MATLPGVWALFSDKLIAGLPVVRKLERPWQQEQQQGPQ
jgi:hypothetical protein